MRKIRERLSNQEGSSLVIAIVILLICTVLGGIVISAASVNMTRVERNKEEQQAYLTAESAALLFRDLLLEQKLMIQADADGNMQTISESSDGFGQMLAEDVGAFLAAGGTAGESIDKTLDFTGTEAAAGQTVTVQYAMNPGYGLELIVQTAKDGKILAQVLAEFPAVLHTNDGVTSLVWNRGTITRLKSESGSA